MSEREIRAEKINKVLGKKPRAPNDFAWDITTLHNSDIIGLYLSNSCKLNWILIKRDGTEFLSTEEVLRLLPDLNLMRDRILFNLEVFNERT